LNITQLKAPEKGFLHLLTGIQVRSQESIPC